MNAIAEQCPDFSKNLIRELSPWFRAGAPRKYAWIGDKSSAGYWACYLCKTVFGEQTCLTKHLQESHSKDYPKVLHCPCCRGKFTKISGLLQHIETQRCSASYAEPSIAALISKLKSEIFRQPWSDFLRPKILYALECDTGDPSYLLVKVGNIECLYSSPKPKSKKRKRSEDDDDDENDSDEDSHRPKICACESCRAIPRAFRKSS